ncbi:MAG: hypothetical protein AB8F94_27665 [Saprospiraceae bacterium]
MKQVNSISKYLLNVDISERETKIYFDAIEVGDYPLTEKEFFILTKIKKSAFLCSLYDSYSAIWDPNNNIRKRFFLILSILETQPNFSSKFLAPLTLWQSIRIMFFGIIKYAICVVLGVILINVLNILFYVNKI